jgi:ABC-type hemin transport system substrate-binding protein
MNIHSEKLELIELLAKTENEGILKKIRSIFKLASEDGRISIEQYNKEIEAAEKRIKKGKFTKHEDLLREAAKW